MTFTFIELESPFPRWLGPYSPARGTRHGLRVTGGQIGVYVQDRLAGESEFWTITDCEGSRKLHGVIREHFRGGRILILPNGFVIKPLQSYVERGERALIGRIQGAICFSGSTLFNLAKPDNLEPGDIWLGPDTIGLEGYFNTKNGHLSCRWYHPLEYGRDNESILIPDSAHLVDGFRKARPGSYGGRVHVTAYGHVFTKEKGNDMVWESYYVGRIDVSKWPRDSNWIVRNH